MQQILVQNISIKELDERIEQAIINALEKFSLSNPTLNQQTLPETLLTKQQAAKYLKVSLPTLSKFVKAGYIRGYTVSGTRMRFKNSDLDKALKQLGSNSYRVKSSLK